MDDLSNLSPFVFATCQVGAEAALKRDLQRRWPGLRLAFSRPGFVTFKRDDLSRSFDFAEPGSPFARTWGVCLGKLQGEQTGELVPQFWRLAEPVRADQLHVWQRDWALPGDRGFEPGISVLAQEIGQQLIAGAPLLEEPQRRLAVNVCARANQTVLDCILVEPNRWWVGVHRALRRPLRFPAGITLQKHRDRDVISRTYWKTLEAITWSQMPIGRGDVVAEIGCAPGGSAQALLERGLWVLGVDPAEVDERLARYRRFRHVQKRASEVKRREFAPVRWLLADCNVAPRYTLDAVEAIVTHPSVHIRGLLLTLKLLEWDLAQEIPNHVDRIRSWGFRDVRVRQLAHQRQEVCVAAMKSRGQRRIRRRPSLGASPWER